MNKKLIMLLTSLSALALVGCGGGGAGDSTKTQIYIENYNGGVGTEWLERSVQRFTEMKKDTSYESGKTGVEFKISKTKLVDTSSMRGSTKAILVTEDTGFPHDLAANGSLMNIDSWVREVNTDGKTIDSKIDEKFKSVLQYGNNHEYFALPHYELYPGATYDYELFTENNFFLSKNETNATKYDLAGESFYFANTKNGSGVKSCGNDGIYGTDDDGLPTSIKEFIALCLKMKSAGVAPIIFPGNHLDYSSLLIEGMLASLVGKSGIESFYTFEGEANIVVGFDETNRNFIYNGSGCAMPIVQKVALSEKDGYKTRQTLERYAALCMIEILEKNECFDKDITTKSGNTNVVCQQLFLEGSRSGTGTKDIGILCEGNYWMNEAKPLFDQFYIDHPEYVMDGKERDVRWMSLPTKISDTVTEGNGSSPALMDTGNSFFLVNASITKRSAGFQQAVKEFVQFLYTDAELQDFTKTTGVVKSGLIYDYTAENVYSNLNTYQKTVLNLKKQFGVAYMASEKKTFLSKRDSLYFSINAPIWHPGAYTSCVGALRSTQGSYGAKECFTNTWISESSWNTNYYQG